MSNRRLSLDNFTESLAGFAKYKELEFGDNGEYKKLVKVLLKAIDGELTSRQRECLILYYGQNLKMSEVASKLDIGIPAVSRHIKKAKFRIKKVMVYYFDNLEN